MENDSNLRRTAVLGALASVAIVVGIVAVVWLVFFRDKSDTSANQVKGDNQTSQQAQNGNQSGNGNSDATKKNQTANNDAANNSGTTPANGTGNGGSKSTNPAMPSTGPRENALVFMGITAAASGIYYIRTKRKLARD